MKKFIQRLFGFSLGPILGALISFIQVPIITHFLSPTEYGKAELFQSLMIQLPNFIYIGMDQAYTREYHRINKKWNLAQNATLVPMIVGLLMCVLFISFDRQISMYLFESPDYVYIVWYSGIWLLASIVERFLLLAIRMEEKAKEYSAFNLLLKITVFIVTMIFIWSGMRDFRSVVYGLIWGQILGDLILFLRYRQFFDFSQFYLDKDLVNRMLKFGLPLMLAVSLTSALQAIDNIFINEYNTKADIAIYGSARKVANVLGIMRTAFTSFWVPTAYRWYEENKSMVHYKYISDALLFFLTGVFFAILLCKSWIVKILGPAYHDGMYIMGLLCFPHIMYTLSETTTLGISFSRKTHLNIYVSIATFIPSILLNYFLTPIYGFRGAAIASSVSYIMFYLARTYFSSQTGFYFGQKKQILSIMVMMFASCLNLFDMPGVTIWTFLLGLLCLVIQSSTLKTSYDIYQSRDGSWDFS